MSLTDWDSRTQHVVLDAENLENPPPASPDDHIQSRTNGPKKIRRTKSRGHIARKLNFSNPKPKKKSICSGVNCSIQGGRRRRKTKRRRRKGKRTKRRRRTKKTRKMRRKKR